ncbi:uncharacterized protein LOC142323573 isoform X1 [Lycorma delicatula]|uniref:uncharacterized protein LOC142323573 isoform X1 n=1 Tax=Lycorma delicatula TaxID=130591 RepID=UPI003F516AC4
MKAVHFKILVDNKEWGNFYLLQQSSCSSDRQVLINYGSHISVDSMCQSIKHKKCPNCFVKDVTIFHVDLIDDGISVENKTNNDEYSSVTDISEEDKNALGKNVMKLLNDHVISGDCWELYHSRRLITIGMSGYFLSQFYKTLLHSPTYRYHVLQNFLYWQPSLKRTNDFQCISINVVSLGYSVIDYKWNERLETMCLERRELDHAMSWLSTLGGAFSALGEKYEHFAYMAGRTSVEQFRLAIRLGDDLIVARCKLYYALSLIQRGYLSPARKIVKQQYDLAKNSVVVDNRLVRMCLGIWAKLKYEYAERRNKKNRLKIISS